MQRRANTWPIIHHSSIWSALYCCCWLKKPRFCTCIIYWSIVALLTCSVFSWDGLVLRLALRLSQLSSSQSSISQLGVLLSSHSHLWAVSQLLLTVLANSGADIPNMQLLHFSGLWWAPEICMDVKDQFIHNNGISKIVRNQVGNKLEFRHFEEKT
jgi:hypothetical protein